MFCPYLLNYSLITSSDHIPIFSWDKSKLTNSSQLINILIQYKLPLLDLLQFYPWPPLHTTLLHMLILYPIPLHTSCFLEDKSLRYFLNKPLLLSQKHKAFELIFLATFVLFFPRTKSATLHMTFQKLFRPSSTLSSFKLSSLIFNCSWKFSPK